MKRSNENVELDQRVYRACWPQLPSATAVRPLLNGLPDSLLWTSRIKQKVHPKSIHQESCNSFQPAVLKSQASLGSLAQGGWAQCRARRSPWPLWVPGGISTGRSLSWASPLRQHRRHSSPDEVERGGGCRGSQRKWCWCNMVCTVEGCGTLCPSARAAAACVCAYAVMCMCPTNQPSFPSYRCGALPTARARE